MLCRLTVAAAMPPARRSTNDGHGATGGGKGSRTFPRWGCACSGRQGPAVLPGWSDFGLGGHGGWWAGWAISRSCGVMPSVVDWVGLVWGV